MRAILPPKKTSKSETPVISQNHDAVLVPFENRSRRQINKIQIPNAGSVFKPWFSSTKKSRLKCVPGGNAPPMEGGGSTKRRTQPLDPSITIRTCDCDVVCGVWLAGGKW
ncbi:hypothetical protein VNO77_17114 [Canavalia gladiata]|uniref:Uncharacterized protein n=1 Tax=Canavalia gladiata TaxID=3824 RepID=A0AAN9LIH1_CANGL